MEYADSTNNATSKLEIDTSDISISNKEHTFSAL